MDTEILFTIIFGILYSVVIILWVEGVDYKTRKNSNN